MGLFDFVKDAGEKMFGSEGSTSAIAATEQAARWKEKVFTDFIRSLQLGVEDLRIQVNGDTALIGGRVTSQELREKVILAVGNIDGIALVDDRLLVRAPKPQIEPEQETVFYTVQKGDTLSGIAKDHYGNATKYLVIFEANQPTLTDPDKIYPGQVLRIPHLPK